MSDQVKIYGLDDIEKLKRRTITWNPPSSLKEYLKLVELVISTSRYTDDYMSDEITIQDFQSYVKMKTRRITKYPDVEECIDVGAYSYMLYHKIMDHID